MKQNKILEYFLLAFKALRIPEEDKPSSSISTELSTTFLKNLLSAIPNCERLEDGIVVSSLKRLAIRSLARYDESKDYIFNSLCSAMQDRSSFDVLNQLPSHVVPVVLVHILVNSLMLKWSYLMDCFDLLRTYKVRNYRLHGE